MKLTKNPTINSLLGHIRDLLLIVLISNLVSFLFSMNLDNFAERLKYSSLYGLFIGSFLWKGNQFIGYVLGKKIDISKQPARALRWNLSTMFVYTIVAILVVNYIWYVIIFGNTTAQMFSYGMISMLIELFVTVIITSIYFSIDFFKSWRESAVNEERLQKESIKLQYKALKNQVNPHFLFNSLNSLSSLVYQDQDQAVKFIKQLSEIYRYVLEHKDYELVSLTEEINFSEKYIFLQKIRHGTGLNVSIKLNDMNNRMVVPVSIQILIENAIKHNIISEDKPLNIKIYNTTDTLVVMNNLQSKKALKESGGIGLSTIKARYSFLSDTKVRIKETKTDFIVELPIIERPHESTDH